MPKINQFALSMDLNQIEGDEIFETLVEAFVTDLQVKGFEKVNYVIQGKAIYTEPKEK